MFFVKEFGDGGFQLNQNFNVAAKHTRAMVAGGISLGCFNGSVLNLLVAKHIQVGVTGERVALKLALHDNLIIAGLINRPHKWPVVRKGLFDIMVAVLLGLVRLDRDLEDFFLEKDDQVVEGTSHGLATLIFFEQTVGIYDSFDQRFKVRDYVSRVNGR
jgi:hypothetical protein